MLFVPFECEVFQASVMENVTGGIVPRNLNVGGSVRINSKLRISAPLKLLHVINKT